MGSWRFATLAVLALMAGLLRPATTVAIVDPRGRTVPGSTAQLVEVPIGGHDQAITLRGDSSKAPVLLFLEGGPGGTGIGRVRSSGDELEQTFVVATWDQRGTGKPYTMAVKRSPEKFAAHVGTGQMVDPFATDKLMYAETIRDAQA